MSEHLVLVYHFALSLNNSYVVISLNMCFSRTGIKRQQTMCTYSTVNGPTVCGLVKQLTWFIVNSINTSDQLSKSKFLLQAATYRTKSFKILKYKDMKMSVFFHYSTQHQTKNRENVTSVVWQYVLY